MAKSVLDKKKERDFKIVKARYIDHESKGAKSSWTSGPFYKGDTGKKYTMTDGDVVEIPLIVAETINNSCWYGVNTHKQGEDGRPSIQIGRKVQRKEFVPLVFSGESDFDGGSSNLVTVERV